MDTLLLEEQLYCIRGEGVVTNASPVIVNTSHPNPDTPKAREAKNCESGPMDAGGRWKIVV